VKDK
jgi:hypothetical protein